MSHGRGVVVVTSRSFGSGGGSAMQRLEDSGYTAVRLPAGHAINELAPALAHAVGWIAGTGPVDDARLALAPNLRVLARYGVGVDNVDLLSAAGRSVVVTNTPGANSSAVAEHTVALLLSVLRGIPDADRRVREGDWSPSLAQELSSLTVGIVGLGRIGRGVIQRLSSFGPTMLGVDPYLADDDPLFTLVGRRTIAELAHECDIVTLHAPSGIVVIDSDWFAACDRPVGVVNTARADLVDESALIAALHTGRVQFYAADALSVEHRSDSVSPLLSSEFRDRVVVTPHLAAQTREAIDSMSTMAVDNVLAVLSGQAPPNSVRDTA